MLLFPLSLTFLLSILLVLPPLPNLLLLAFLLLFLLSFLFVLSFLLYLLLLLPSLLSFSLLLPSLLSLPRPSSPPLSSPLLFCFLLSSIRPLLLLVLLHFYRNRPTHHLKRKRRNDMRRWRTRP